jgi:hypothetical protein
VVGHFRRAADRVDDRRSLTVAAQQNNRQDYLGWETSAFQSFGVPPAKFEFGSTKINIRDNTAGEIP